MIICRFSLCAEQQKLLIVIVTPCLPLWEIAQRSKDNMSQLSIENTSEDSFRQQMIHSHSLFFFWLKCHLLAFGKAVLCVWVCVRCRWDGVIAGFVPPGQHRKSFIWTLSGFLPSVTETKGNICLWAVPVDWIVSLKSPSTLWCTVKCFAFKQTTWFVSLDTEWMHDDLLWDVQFTVGTNQNVCFSWICKSLISPSLTGGSCHSSF